VQYESPRVQLLGKINVWDKNKFPAGATAGYLPSYTVEGTIQAFHPPAGGYFVECIFVGKREGTLKPVVCNVSGTVVRGDYPPIMLDIPPPSSAGYYALPGMKYKFTDPNTKNESNTPAAVDDVTKVTFDDPRAGLPGGGMPVNIKFPIVGWMVRILAGGQASTTPGPYGRPRSMTYTGGEVVYTGGSDDTLATLVRDNPAYFQKLYEIYSAPPPAAQPGMDGYPGQRRPGMPPQ